MHYEFPKIENISDVEAAIADYDEILRAERIGHTILNYMVLMPGTFDMTDENDVFGALRRECRGLLFDADGTLISRPFHKFFNLGERAETQMEKLDFSKPHNIFEKMDGSMVHGFIFNGAVRLGTRMGMTEVAAQAEEWLFKHDNLCHEIRDFVNAGITPIFEWVSPENRIVIRYDEPKMVLLALRDRLTGNYLSLPNFSDFDIVANYGSVKDREAFEAHIEEVKEYIGREGNVIRYMDGHMLKVKATDYVRIHKIKDEIRFPRHIVARAIDNGLDDILPELDQEDRIRVNGVAEEFWVSFNRKLAELSKLADRCETEFNSDKKRIALELVPTLKNKTDARFLFAAVNGKTLRNTLMDYVTNNLNSNTKFDQLMEYMR